MDNTTIEESLTKYYTRYYRDECCLSDWQKRVTNRLKEEGKEKERMQLLARDFNFNFKEKKHVIVGAGTAGLAVILKNEYSADVFGVEPDNQEFEIIKLICKREGVNEANFHKAYGENLPFKDSSFDFTHCFTVLEHVQDVEKCLDEMIRVTKSGGRILITTPNYAFPYEGHYKIHFPTFLPKLFGYLYLLILGKDYKFYSTINRVTEKSINRILIKKTGIKWLRLYKPRVFLRGVLGQLLNYLIFKRFVYPQQDIVIIKE
jgi:ubiquinone/menaquinone biosynthesis C-methylase UbiE